MLRLYVMPLDTVGNRRGPRYFQWQNHPGMAVDFGLVDFGFEPTCITSAETSDLQHAQLIGHPDVSAIPMEFDDSVAGAVPAIQSVLEGLNVPADWVNASMTWRELIRKTCGIFFLLQKLNGLLGNISIFAGTGRDLNTRFGDLPPDVANAIQTAMDEIGFGALPNNETMRSILKSYGEAWKSMPFWIGELTV